MHRIGDHRALASDLAFRGGGCAQPAAGVLGDRWDNLSGQRVEPWRRRPRTVASGWIRDHSDVTAGANFQLPYRASFLLPHRRSAWLRFAGRLDELAHFAAGLRSQGGEDVTATVSGALSRTASNLMSHVEAV
jgi:hypothetical protein